MNWDWGRPFGAKPGEYSRFGRFMILLWFILGNCFLVAWFVNLLSWPALVPGIAALLLSIFQLVMAAGLISHRSR